MTKKNVQNITSTVEVVKQKRGRKPKNQLVDTNVSKQPQNASENNIVYSIQETENANDPETNIVDEFLNDEDKINYTDEENKILTNQEEQKPGGKKRGRKPKGGKIIQQVVSNNNNKETKPNIILHLKCFLKDLQSTTLLGSIDSFNFSGKNEINYEIISSNENIITKTSNNTCFNDTINTITTSNNMNNNDYEDDYFKNKENDIRDVWKKLKVLEHNLHINNISDKKSACFWCTYEFDNPPVYIPKHFIKDSYHVYGCFCSPECATAYLMEENIDSSSKFERYHLINHVYSKIYDYKKNIKPAPNPFYLLDKYYGNLSIQEYRSLLRNERLFLVVDKPLTRILPELHEDNDDFIINNKIIPANTLLIKNKLQKKQQNKNTILNEKFGLTQ
jgi:hypothetical protein